MFSLKNFLTVAATLSFASLVGCATQAEQEQEAPVEVTVEGDNAIDPNYQAVYVCEYGAMFGFHGPSHGPYYLDDGPPPTSAECHSWCHSCGRSGGALQINYYDFSLVPNQYSSTFLCTCY